VTRQINLSSVSRLEVMLLLLVFALAIDCGIELQSIASTIIQMHRVSLINGCAPATDLKSLSGGHPNGFKNTVNRKRWTRQSLYCLLQSNSQKLEISIVTFIYLFTKIAIWIYWSKATFFSSFVSCLVYCMNLTTLITTLYVCFRYHEEIEESCMLVWFLLIFVLINPEKVHLD
jgi:hypothetical protein